jgi:4'-phosphopantetheinyl transferase
LKYYHVKDAKMSLASHLLKHLVITKYGGVPWSKSIISRDANGKPKWDPAGLGLKDPVKIGFNVSHQAGLVSLIAVIGGDGNVEVGTDVVCANERLAHDYRHIEKDGFFDWVGMHGDVFAESEVSFMKLGPVELDLEPGMKLMGYGNNVLSRCQWRNQKLEVKVVTEEERSERVIIIDSNVVIDKKLRRFYAMWCLREAYVKMTGEALLAPWLKELEISEVRVPVAKRDICDPLSLEEGEVVKEFRIIFKGRLVTNVQMELSALGTDYMVASSARSLTAGHDAGLEMGKWKLLDLENEVLAFGQVMH